MKTTIIHCRPNQLGDELCKEAKVNNIDCIKLALFELESILLQPDFMQKIKCLKAPLKHIFVSHQAVQSSLAYFSEKQLFYKSERSFCLGISTLKQLKKHNFINSTAPNSSYNSEALLDLDELHKVSQQNFIIWCGAEGRKLIKNTLLARGANVYEAIVYERKILKIPSQMIECLQNLQQPIFLASSMHVLEQLSIMLKQLPSNTILLAISERILKAAKQYSWKQTELLDSLDTRDIIKCAKKLTKTN